MDLGEVLRGVGLRRAGDLAAIALLGRIGEGVSPFHFLLMISQDQTKGLLREAVNLGWKLAAVLTSAVPTALFATYETERRPFAQRLVASTDRAFTATTRATAWAGFVRTQVVPRLAPLALRLP
ncbi:FAD-dependent monooxygenase [Hymenobacter antarcticus]|uniref:FAD-binding domain-containing protein n=1 Tax=Hymenobacter antarcticus TaxID=486270 RepID=A0ABP7P5E3_9BACT